MVVSNRGGLEGGPKAEKLVVSSSFSTTSPILFSVLSGCRELRLVNMYLYVVMLDDNRRI